MSGGTGAAAGTAGAGGGSTTTVGTPTITYTAVNHTGGTGGTGGGSNTLGGGGGGGAGGTAANGGGGGSPTSTGGGGGGGGGAANAGGSPSTATGGTGGAGTTGTGGSGGATGGTGTGSSGGGGGTGGAASTGGPGGSGTDFQTAPAFGFGGGGGGSGGKTTTTTVNLTGGAGGSFGGGGGGTGCLRTSGGTITVGAGAAGLIAIFYVSAVAWPPPDGYYPEATQRRTSRRAVSFITGHSGAEQPLMNVGNVGGLVQPPQPQARYPAMASRYAAFADGDDGVQKPFVPTASAFVVGDAPTTNRWARPRPGPGLAGRSQFAYSSLQQVEFDQAWQPYRAPFNRGAAVKQRLGFLAASLAPWHEVRHEMWRRPPRRQSMVGDDGAERPMATPTTPWLEVSPTIVVNGKRQKAASIARGNDGDEGPINLGTFGFDVQQWQARHPRFRNLDAGDGGAEAPFSVQVAPWGYAFDGFVRQTKRPGPALAGRSQFAYSSLQAVEFDQTWQPLYPKARRFEATRQRIGFAAFSPALASFLQDHQAPLRARTEPRRWGALDEPLPLPAIARTGTFLQDHYAALRAQRREISALKHRVDFSWFTYLPWFEVNDEAWRRPARRLITRPSDPDFPMIASAALAAWGWEQPWSQPPRRPLERGEGVVGGSEFAWFTYVPYFFDQPWQPPRPPRRPLVMGDDGSYAKFVPPGPLAPWGYAFDGFVRRFVRRGTALAGRSQFAYSQLTPMTWEVGLPAPYRVRRNLAGGVKQRIGFGASAPTIFVPQFDQAWQPPHTRRERAGALFGGDVGTEEPFVVLAFKPQFDQAWQPPRRPWERRGAFLRGDEGDQAKYVPTFLEAYQALDQAFQPPRRRWNLDGGISGRSEFARFTYVPWHEVNSAMWRRPPRRQDPRGDDGVEGRFVAPTFAPQFDQPFHARLRRKPVPLLWPWNVDTGLVNLPPVGWEPVLPTLVHRFWHDPDLGDGGITFPFAPTILGPSVCFAGDVAIWVAMTEDGEMWVVSAADIAESES